MVPAPPATVSLAVPAVVEVVEDKLEELEEPELEDPELEDPEPETGGEPVTTLELLEPEDPDPDEEDELEEVEEEKEVGMRNSVVTFLELS